MTAAIYARVSTADKEQDPEVQLCELREDCARRGWSIAGEYFDKLSGAKKSRPGLDRLMADAREKKFDVVVVWRFNRFARSVQHLLTALEEFQALGLGFVSMTEGIDTSTPMGKMVFTILGAIAEMEREVIRENVRSGLRRARANGKRPGRRPKGIDVGALRLARCDGASYGAIASRFGVSASTAHRIINSRCGS